MKLRKRNRAILAIGITASFCLLATGCLQVNDDVTDAVDAPQTPPVGTTPELQSLGVPIGCRAPDREEYIEAHTDTSIDENEVDTEAREHSILFVFDRSGSMDHGWHGSTKWEAAADAMLEIVQRYQSYVTAGAIFYPTNECEVAPITDEQQIDFTDAGQFMALWEQRTNTYLPDGSTPMNRAFEEADRAIASACADGLMDRPLRVVVLTDGAPNCELDETLLLGFPAKWHELGVNTYVIGLTGYGAVTLLNDITEAGGTLPEPPDTDADSDGSIDEEWDSDGDGVIDTDFDTEGVMESNTVYDLNDNLTLAIE